MVYCLVWLLSTFFFVSSFFLWPEDKHLFVVAYFLGLAAACSWIVVVISSRRGRLLQPILGVLSSLLLLLLSPEYGRTIPVLTGMNELALSCINLALSIALALVPVLRHWLWITETEKNKRNDPG